MYNYAINQAGSLPPVSNPSFVESRMIQSHRMGESLELSMRDKSLSRQQIPQVDFHKLTPDQQVLFLTWSQKQQEESQQQMQYASLPFTQFQQFGSQTSLPNQNFQQQQQQIIDNYYQQIQVNDQNEQQQQLQQQQQQQLAQWQIDQQQQLYNQEVQKTTYDQNILYDKWQQQCGQILTAMQPHQSLNEPIMQDLYKYFDASEEQQLPHIGQAYVLTNKLNPQFKLALKVVNLDKYTTYIQEEKILQLKKIELTHPNLINMHLIHTKKYVCLCFATFRVCVLMDYIQDNCQTLIEHKHFQEQDIWHILESMTEALYLLHLKGIVHGRLSLDYILISQLIDNTQIYKLYYNPNDSNALQFKFNNHDSQVFLSPEQYQAYLMNDLSNQPTWKSDVFSLGLCLIALMLGRNNFKDLYAIYQQDFNEIEFHNIIKSISSQYSHKLINTITLMTKTQISQRLDWVSLTTHLSQFHHPQMNYINLIYTLDVQQRMETKLRQKNMDKTLDLKNNSVSQSHIQKVDQSAFSIDNMPSILQRAKSTYREEVNSGNVIENRNKRKINYEDGSFYEGEVYNGLRDGIGQFISSDFKYDGCWKSDRYGGQGTLYENGQLCYEGAFKYGLYEGYGKQRNNQAKYFEGNYNYKNFNTLDGKWINYAGDFRNGQFNGFGCLELSNGEKMTCAFRDGVPDGVGVFETLDKRRVNGQWDMGLLVRRI